jgi:hypothetical protein
MRVIFRKQSSKKRPGEKIMVHAGNDRYGRRFQYSFRYFLIRGLHISELGRLCRSDTVTKCPEPIFEETLRERAYLIKFTEVCHFTRERKIKDILAYFRMVINPGDEEAFKRSVNYPKRGIGDTTVQRYTGPGFREKWFCLDHFK